MGGGLRRRGGRASGDADGVQHVGRVAASQVGHAGPRCNVAGRRAVHQRHGSARDRSGALRRDLRRAGQDDHGRHGLQAGRRSLPVDHQLRLGPGLVQAGRRGPRPRRAGRGSHGRDAAPPGPGPQGSRGARSDHRGRRRQHAALLPLHPRGRERRRRLLLAVAHRILGRARLRAVLLGRGRAAAVEGGAARPASLTVFGRSGCRRSRRCGSSPGCCSPTSTTSRTRPTRSRSVWTMWSSSTSPETSWVATR